MIHIVIGEKLVRRRIGVVGDFCPFCRQLSQVQAVQTRRVSHVNYIGVGRGRHVATELECDACDSLRGAGPSEVAPTRLVVPDLAELVAKTNPGAMDTILKRIDLEERVRAGSATSAERKELLREPFAALDYATRLGQQSNGDGVVALVMLVFAVLFASWAWLQWDVFVASGYTSWINAVWAALLTVAAGIQARRTVVRTLQNIKLFRRCRPGVRIIATALRPLQPTLEELTASLEDARRRRYAVDTKLTANDLFSAIQGQMNPH